jgi:hypothetical protein
MATEVEDRSMAAKWVELYDEWLATDIDNNPTQADFVDWLYDVKKHPRDDIYWISTWDARPVDQAGRASATDARSYSIMDFSDGSIAIQRNHPTPGVFFVAGELPS